MLRSFEPFMCIDLIFTRKNVAATIFHVGTISHLTSTYTALSETMTLTTHEIRDNQTLRVRYRVPLSLWSSSRVLFHFLHRRGNNLPFLLSLFLKTFSHRLTVV